MIRERTLIGFRGSLPGALSLAFLLTIIGGALIAILSAAGSTHLISIFRDPYLQKVVLFTLWQASLSTLLSVGFAVPVARALARRSHFRGRAFLVHLLGLPVVMPVIVAVFGLIAVYGKNGLLGSLIISLSNGVALPLYGLGGILLAHVFFNLPLAIRILLPAWQAIPEESWKLAGSLGISGGSLFRFIEWPAVSQHLPGICLIVFLLCFTSFAVVLTLGGGPASTTIEVAIYQSLRYDFEPAQAAVLALIQLALCTLVAIVLLKWINVLTPSSGRRIDSRHRPDLARAGGRFLDAALILAAGSFLFVPVLAVLLQGIRGPIIEVISQKVLWEATLRSLLIAFGATATAGCLAIGLALSARLFRFSLKMPRTSDFWILIGSLSLAIPPMIIGTGLFIVLLRADAVDRGTLIVISAVNALMVLPYLLRSIAPPLMQFGHQHHRLCAQLGLAGWQRFRLVDWPVIRRPVAFALGLGAALSFGDMGVAALLDTQGATTLPVLLFHQMGAYRFDEAAVTALLLTTISLTLFWLIDRLVGR